MEDAGLKELLSRLPAPAECALLLVKEEFGQVVGYFADTFGSESMIEPAAVKTAEGGKLSSDGWIAIVHVADEVWVCVYVAIGQVTRLHREITRGSALDLSSTGGSIAIAVIVSHQRSDPTSGTTTLSISPAVAAVDDTTPGETSKADDSSHEPVATDEPVAGAREATSGESRGPRSVSYEVFEDGQAIEKICWRDGDDFDVWHSALRETPPEPPVNVAFLDRLVRDRGILLPVCCAAVEGERGHLKLWHPLPGSIERATLMRLVRPSFYEEETLEMVVDDVPDADAEAQGRDGAEVDSPPDDASIRSALGGEEVVHKEGFLSGLWRRLRGR